LLIFDYAIFSFSDEPPLYFRHAAFAAFFSPFRDAAISPLMPAFAFAAFHFACAMPAAFRLIICRAADAALSLSTCWFTPSAATLLITPLRCRFDIATHYFATP